MKAAIFSFFSGVGFLDLGFENSGFEICSVNEIHKPFLDAYKYSREHLHIAPPRFGYHNCNINDFLAPQEASLLKEHINRARSDGYLAGFIGGPPCPDFSVGGKNRGRNGDNGKLSQSYVDIICQQRPDFFVFENVKGLWQTKKHREFYDHLKDQLQKSGYTTSERLINALEYGVPQDRQRIILIGISKKIAGKRLDFPWLKYAQVSSDKILSLPWPALDTFEEGSVKKAPRLIPQELTTEYWFRKNDVCNHSNALDYFTPQAALGKFKVIQEGDDSRKSFKRLHRWRYSPTACYGNNEVHLHPYYARRISAAEALAIQSLPKEYELPASMTLTNMFKAIGNGVPYLAAYALARSLADVLGSLHSEKKVVIRASNTKVPEREALYA